MRGKRLEVMGYVKFTVYGLLFTVYYFLDALATRRGFDARREDITSY